MRRIVKTGEPASFIEWKSQANENWTPTFAILPNPHKRDLLQKLIEEQGGTCCYCGRSINESSAHIEHFRPQSKATELALEYSNLFASCIRETCPGSPLHCGHLKGDWFDEQSYISPLDADCEYRFAYDLSGGIAGTDTNSDTMINVLGLNTPPLSAERQSALTGVFDPDFLISATSAELEILAVSFRSNANGTLPSCFQAVARYAEQLLEP